MRTAMAMFLLQTFRIHLKDDFIRVAVNPLTFVDVSRNSRRFMSFVAVTF